MKNAIYVTDCGSEEKPKGRMGLCQLSDVSEGPKTVFVVQSDEAPEIYRLAGATQSIAMLPPESDVTEYDDTPLHLAMSVRAACEVDIIGRPSFLFSVVKDTVLNGIR